MEALPIVFLVIVVGVIADRLWQIRDQLARIGDKLQAILAAIEEQERLWELRSLT